MSELPAPLVPPDLDLTKFPFMPLHVERLLKSDTWIEAGQHPFLGHAMMSLWAASWHEVPAGSLPMKAVLLARHAHRSMQEFEEIAPFIKDQWVLCSDNRLYHPVVCEIALEAWEKLKVDRNRTTAATAAAAEKRKARNGLRDVQRDGEEPPTPPPADPPVKVERVRKPKPRLDRDGNSPDFTPGFIRFWNAYPKKEAKQEAWKSWRRDAEELGLEEFVDTLIRDINARMRSDRKWKDGFIPMASTYLNQRRWNDGGTLETQREITEDERKEQARKAREDELENTILSIESDIKLGITSRQAELPGLRSQLASLRGRAA